MVSDINKFCIYDKPLLILVGPTAIGKTELALQIAEKFNCEIIGVDSMQVYKYMDIGTAKPTHGERNRVEHHLVDYITPDVQYNAHMFVEDCNKAITKITNKGKIPLLAGGTGLYVKSLLEGIFSMPQIDKNIRENLQREIKKVGGGATLYQELRNIDKVSADRIHPNDSYRIVRALEIYKSTGVSWSDFIAVQKKTVTKTTQKVIKIGLKRSRDKLYERINMRVNNMINDGLLDEVKKLMKMGYGPKLKSMQSLGYRHMVNFLQGSWTWQESIDFLARDTRRYAKRQLTWFNNDKEIHWIETGEHQKVFKKIELFLAEN